MSNYPPGVSGFEPQIAGSHELDDSRLVDECVNVGEYRIMRIAGKYRYDFSSTAIPKRYTRNTNRRVQAKQCTFEGGAVDGIVYDHATFAWECPSCGYENEVDVSGDFEEPEREYEPWDY